MNNYFWLVVLPNIGCFFGVIEFLTFIVLVIAFIIYFHIKLVGCEEIETLNYTTKCVINLSIAFIMIFFISVFIPSKKDIIQLKAISIMQEIKGIDQIPQKVIDKLNDLLDDKKER